MPLLCSHSGVSCTRQSWSELIDLPPAHCHAFGLCNITACPALSQATPQRDIVRFSNASIAAEKGGLHLCRRLGREGKAWWCADLVHIVYSAGVFLAASAYIYRCPRALFITWSPTEEEAGALPDMLVCISAGFFGFQLWALVCTRWAVPQLHLCPLCTRQRCQIAMQVQWSEIRPPSL